MNNTQFIITVFVLSLSVLCTRAIPFIVFRDAGKLPGVIEYLGRVLPAAMMGLLVIYCFKDYDFTSAGEIIPAIVSGLCVAGLHLWKRNTVISISAGTALYMILIRII